MCFRIVLLTIIIIKIVKNIPDKRRIKNQFKPPFSSPLEINFISSGFRQISGGVKRVSQIPLIITSLFKLSLMIWLFKVTRGTV